MQVYFAIKFKEDNSNKELIDSLSDSLKKIGIDTYVMARDFEKWGENKVEPDVLMANTFKVIDGSDALVVEFSEKGVGLGIEAGYTFAKHKPIIVIAKEGSEISSTMQGIAKRVFFYKKFEDIVSDIKNCLSEIL